MQAKLQCAIYTRVSTDMQAEVEFNSCEAQEEKIKSFIQSQENMVIYKVYVDAGFTGANINRPALTQMLNDVRQNKINLVISYKIDRLTRSPKDFYQMIEIFEKYGVNFISVTERFDTSTPAGRLLRNIMLTFAQFERELTSERIKDKMLERAKKGMWNGGAAPFGYEPKDKKLSVNESAAKIIKEIYDKYLFSRSLAAVYEDLKHRGVTQPNGRPFSKSGIWQLLRNPVFTGKIKYSGKYLPGNHTPIISQEMFDAAQAIHRTQKSGVKLYRDFALGGIVRCLECGSIMTPHYTNKRKGKSLKRFYYYRCTKTAHETWGSCSTRQVSANRLEDYIHDNLKRISLDKQYLDSFVFSFNGRAALDGRIGSLDSSKNPPENGLSARQDGLELSSAPAKITPEIFAQTLAAAGKALSELRGTEKSLACRRVFEQINYSKESIEIRIKGGVSEIPAQLSGDEKTGVENAGLFSSNIQSGCLAWTRTMKTRSRILCVANYTTRQINYQFTYMSPISSTPCVVPKLRFGHHEAKLITDYSTKRFAKFVMLETGPGLTTHFRESSHPASLSDSSICRQNHTALAYSRHTCGGNIRPGTKNRKIMHKPISS